MGYSREYVERGGPIVLDIETAPIDGADVYVPPPDLENIQAAKNLKDPIKVMEDVAKRRAEALASHAEKLAKAALDFNLARVVAIGWSVDNGVTVEARACQNEDTERTVLGQFWQDVHNRSFVGFRIRTFDAPMLMARSRFLDVNCPSLDLSRYGRSGRIIDLWDVLTYGLSDYETTVVMPRKLKTYAQRYGVSVPDAINGSDIGALVASGEWVSVMTHVTADVRLTAALACRLGVLPPVDLPYASKVHFERDSVA